MDTQKHLNWRPLMSALTSENYENQFAALMAACCLAIHRNNDVDAVLYASKINASLLIVDGHIGHGCSKAAALWARWAPQLLGLEAVTASYDNAAAKAVASVLHKTFLLVSLITPKQE